MTLFDVCLTSDVCMSVCMSHMMSVAYIRLAKSRTERPIGRPKLAQSMCTSHVTRTPLSS